MARQASRRWSAIQAIWQNTALFITYDENGGFFDHVKPPTAPEGHGRRVPDGVQAARPRADGIRGPIGLGFRVPMLVVSPFSRGGLLCSDTFDHTSTLRFLETRFGVKVPEPVGVAAEGHRRSDSAFNFAARPKPGRPSLPTPANDKCSTYAAPSSTSGPFPKQETSPKRKKPSGVV